MKSHRISFIILNDQSRDPFNRRVIDTTLAGEGAKLHISHIG